MQYRITLVMHYVIVDFEQIVESRKECEIQKENNKNVLNLSTKRVDNAHSHYIVISE